MKRRARFPIRFQTPKIQVTNEEILGDLLYPADRKPRYRSVGKGRR